MGRSLKGRGSQKTCLNRWRSLRGLRPCQDLEDKKGTSPDRYQLSVRGFFWGRKEMHLYWRIKEELLYLGEVLVFVDPRFIREYRRWVEKTCIGHGKNLRN